tara:strand:- start:383 stop:682 length:300 start_codon:yes stop_codon:yes gene_type:complete
MPTIKQTCGLPTGPTAGNWKKVGYSSFISCIRAEKEKRRGKGKVSLYPDERRALERASEECAAIREEWKVVDENLRQATIRKGVGDRGQGYNCTLTGED